MNQIPRHEPQRYSSDDEISLIDLAKILIKQWKIMGLAFLVAVLGALAYVLSKERLYEYVSIYQLAEESPGSALEVPNSVSAKVNNLYVGEEARRLRESAGLEGLPFDVTMTNPSDTLFIRLGSEASENNYELVAQMHEALLDRMMEGQREFLEKRRAALEQRLQSTERALQAAEQSSSENAGELTASYTERLAEIQQKLAQLSEGEVVQVAIQSLKPVGTGRSLIMVLAIMLGGVLAVMTAFFAEFALKVRESLKLDSMRNK